MTLVDAHDTLRSRERTDFAFGSEGADDDAGDIQYRLDAMHAESSPSKASLPRVPGSTRPVQADSTEREDASGTPDAASSLGMASEGGSSPSGPESLSERGIPKAARPTTGQEHPVDARSESDPSGPDPEDWPL